MNALGVPVIVTRLMIGRALPTKYVPPLKVLAKEPLPHVPSGTAASGRMSLTLVSGKPGYTAHEKQPANVATYMEELVIHATGSVGSAGGADISSMKPQPENV